MTSLSPPQVVLLAVNLAAQSDIQGLTALAACYYTVLRPELLLRVLLTCLPETLPSSEYTSLVERIAQENLDSDPPTDFDASSIEQITDHEAAKKVRRLHLLPLPGSPDQDPVQRFLIHRAYRVDQEAGLLTQLPDLLVPFLQHSPYIRTWTISVLLPLLRRNHEYYPNAPTPQSLESFERLDSRAAVVLLLSQTGQDLQYVGRDLRGLIAPWLYHDPSAWDYVLEWLVAQAATSWQVAVKAVDQWDGPSDIDTGGYGNLWVGDNQQERLDETYARAALASAYLIPDATVEALTGTNTILTKIMSLLDQDPCPTLPMASSLLPPLAHLQADHIGGPKSASFMRNDLLDEANCLTAPNDVSTNLLHALTLSAYILTKAGAPCTVRRAGELVFLQDEREQRTDAKAFIRSIGANGPKNDDKYWVRARNELLWLRDWGAEEAFDSAHARALGIFSQLDKEFLEVECLKAFLSGTRYSLARSIYEDSPERPLSDAVLQETVMAAAMEAYDNASNPNRSRGGLLKCNDIIHAFPKSLPETHPSFKQTEALLKATHALSDYRLVLKKGEPFTPVVLKVQNDPVSIIDKVLEQNPKSYTRIQDLLDIGLNILHAGLPVVEKKDHAKMGRGESTNLEAVMQRRIIAMCGDAALNEDDFETAYSYVVNRLSSDAGLPLSIDDYSWKAALQAGKYRRTARTIRPTHIGTASGNLDIRHLEQRIECLSTALRIAPSAALQEILNVFRKCEEELNAAVAAEEAQESAWDDRGDIETMPGAFSSTVPAGVIRNVTRASGSRRTEEAPMSLLDLSRASVARAQRNFSALSSLQRSEQSRSSDTGVEGSDQPRVRKRDQLREAAVGTLASGVGWLIGAQPVDRSQDRE
ncbi:secretory pathway Sec39 [Xylariaceae sp. FL0255]|nr:secretory pathway Sec39 [Xylariaceae sp. FL0255]